MNIYYSPKNRIMPSTEEPPVTSSSVISSLTLCGFCAFCSNLCQCLLDSCTISSWVMPEENTATERNISSCWIKTVNFHFLGLSTFPPLKKIK